jgi:hypothetical protein
VIEVLQEVVGVVHAEVLVAHVQGEHGHVPRDPLDCQVEHQIDQDEF